MRVPWSSLFGATRSYLAVGQNQWYHFGVGAPPNLFYFTGGWDVHWGYGLLNHSHLDPCPGLSGQVVGATTDEQQAAAEACCLGPKAKPVRVSQVQMLCLGGSQPSGSLAFELLSV